MSTKRQRFPQADLGDAILGIHHTPNMPAFGREKAVVKSFGPEVYDCIPLFEIRPFTAKKTSMMSKYRGGVFEYKRWGV